MKEFMRYIAASCVSFTFSTIFYLSFSFWSIFPPLTEEVVVNMLLLSMAIIFLIYLVHLLPIENSISFTTVRAFFSSLCLGIWLEGFLPCIPSLPITLSSSLSLAY